MLRTSAGDNDECCASYGFNSATNLVLPDEVLNQVCGTTITYDVDTPAPIYGVYEGTDNNIFINTLSHLNNGCTPGTKHVMNSFILQGQEGVQRTLSIAESEILCSLGFPSPEGCTDIEDCITIAGDDGTYFVGQGETINIYFADLLANDITNDNTPVLVENCGISDGLNIEQIVTGFQVNGNTNGAFSFCYTITDCDGACDVATVKVVVTNPAITTACDDTENCQINPYTDLNIFDSRSEMQLALSNGLGGDGFGNNFLFVGGFGGNTPDLYRGNTEYSFSTITDCDTESDPDREFLTIDEIGLASFVANGIGTLNEGIVIPLCEPIMPNMTADVTFFAITHAACVEIGTEVRIDFTELPPLSGEVIYDNPGTAIPSLFSPITASIGNPQNDGRNTVIVHNNSDACLNYLYMSTSFMGNATSEELLSGSRVFVGDIEVKIKNDLSEILNLTSTPNISNPIIGEVINIEISLENAAACSGNTADYPASILSLQLPSGVIHEPNDDFPETNIFIDENELDPDGIYTLRVRVDDPTLLGQELIINATMNTADPCYDGTIISEIVTIVPCLQPTPDFTAQLVDGECGIYYYSSAPSTTGSTHRWYLNEQNENALFSMEVNPTNHILPDGDHTIIHVVEDGCGTETFEVNLPLVDCGNFLFACPCEGDDAINVEAGTGTSLSQLISEGEMPVNGINSKCLAINGHLIIDASSIGNSGFYEILNSEVRMQPGSSITVQPGGALSIFGNNSDFKVHGCEELWRGIKLESAPDGGEGGRLYLGGAIVEDAVNAIELGDKSIFEMVLSTLNNNYRGIYMPKSASEEFQTVAQPTFPFLSSITSTGQLLPHYLGESQNFANSHACIELNDCNGFQIGGGNLFGVIMSDANTGVVANNSNVSIFRSAIFNMIPNGFEIGTNTGIYANNSLVELRNSRLFNLWTGIYGNKSSLLAMENTIGEIPDGDIRGDIENGISLSTDFGNIVRVSDRNVLNVTGNGIRVSNAQKAGNILIQDNIVDLHPDLGNSGFGIWLTDAMLSGENDERLIVSGNEITISEYGHGITMTNVNGTTIANNIINYSSVSNRGYAARGIFLSSASDNYLFNNTILGNSPVDDQRGIEVYSGDRNSLCCNIVKNSNIGTSFVGLCDGTNLRHTMYDGNEIGLQCFEATRIGQQFAAGNMWNISTSVQARHLSENLTDIIESRFFVAGLPGSETRPIFETQANVNVEWFANGPTALSCEADIDNCERPSLNDLTNNFDFVDKVLQDSFYYGNYPETSDWEAKRVLYRSQVATKLSERTNWSTANQAFFQQQSQEASSLSELTNIDQTIEGFMSSDSSLTEVVSQISLIKNQILDLDRMIVEGEAPSEEYLNQRKALLLQEASVFTEYYSLLQQKKTDFRGIAEQLNQSNEELSPIIEAAVAMKEVNNWYLETMALGLDSLPLSTETSLREMAERCPQRFGSAVGRSQAILIHYDKPFIPSNICKEDEKIDSNKSKESMTEKQLETNSIRLLENFIVYPNPSMGILNIELPDNEGSDSWSVELFDAQGRLVNSQLQTVNRTSIKTAGFSPGVYLLRIRSKDSLCSKRVIIQ